MQIEKDNENCKNKGQDQDQVRRWDQNNDILLSDNNLF